MFKRVKKIQRVLAKFKKDVFTTEEMTGQTKISEKTEHIGDSLN
jgi:hypothetical protein